MCHTKYDFFGRAIVKQKTSIILDLFPPSPVGTHTRVRILSRGCLDRGSAVSIPTETVETRETLSHVLIVRSGTSLGDEEAQEDEGTAGEHGGGDLLVQNDDTGQGR